MPTGEPTIKQEIARPSRRQFLRHWLPDTVLDWPQSIAQTAVSQPQSNTLPEIGIIALNRIAYGPRPGDLAAFNTLGANAQDRLFAYIEQQLDPDNITDTDFETRLAAASFTTTSMTLSDMWTTYNRNPSGGNNTFRRTPAHELEVLTFMRAVYSEKQLFEILANFWHNHFSIYAWNLPEACVYMSYDRDVIRPHTLGNFRAMVEAVAKSTAMMYYLDNYANKDSGPNENWSRELFELHGMGAENYMGVADPANVPLENGVPVAFVDDDVFEITRAFTGWTVSNSKSDPLIGDSGEFYYRTDWHDYGEKVILGQTLPANQAALKDAQDAMDIMASHMGTARFVCRKLVRRLVSDNPPNDLVESAAVIFNAQWQASDQIKQVVRHILRSDAFQTTWGMKVKRPFELAVSSLRATNAKFAFDLTESNTASFINQYDKVGQPLYAWHPPNGYPDVAGAWRSSTSLVMRWRLLAWLVDRVDSVNGGYHLPINETHPADRETPNEIADYWIDRLLSRTIGATERQIIVDFLAQGGDPDSPINLTSNSGLKQIRVVAALIMSSSDFQWK